MLRFLGVLAACLLSLSCQSILGGSEDFSSLVFSTDRTSYVAGDSVVVRLENRGTSTFYYNLCGTGIERETSNGSWATVPNPGICLMNLSRLSPGGTRDYTLGLPEAAPAGRHRFWTEVEQRPGGEGRIYTNEVDIST